VPLPSRRRWNGSRISDYMGLEILAKWITQAHVQAVLDWTGLTSKRYHPK